MIEARTLEPDPEAPCQACNDLKHRKMRETILGASSGAPVDDILPPIALAEFRLSGYDFTALLCTPCAVLAVKGLASMVILRSQSAGRELEYFFGAKKRPKVLARNKRAPKSGMTRAQVKDALAKGAKERAEAEKRRPRRR